MVQHTSILTMADQIAIKSRMIYRTAPFSMTLNDPYRPTPSLKVTPFFDAEYLRNGTTYSYKHSVNEILIGTYTRPTQQCHFEWLWVFLSYLAKCSVTRSVTYAVFLRQLSFFFKLHKKTFSLRIFSAHNAKFNTLMIGREKQKRICQQKWHHTTNCNYNVT